MTTIETVYLTHVGTHPKTGQPRRAFWTSYLAQRPDGGWRAAFNYGRLGANESDPTDGQVQVKDFPDSYGASLHINKKISEKAQEGYREHPEPPAGVVRRGTRLLDLPKPEAPRTPNLLEVCETDVATAVEAIRRRGDLTGDTLATVRKARTAMVELEARYAELRGLMDTVDDLLTAKVT